MTPLWEDFMRLGPLACIGVAMASQEGAGRASPFPSGEVRMSPALLAALRLTHDSQPRDMDQWLELCHPSDHARVRKELTGPRLTRALAGGTPASITMTRRMYCGDGVYRSFRLDACVVPSAGGGGYLMGVETPVNAEQGGDWLRKLHEERERLQGILRDAPLSPLSSWLQSASDGDRVEFADSHGRLRTFEAQIICGEKALLDVTAMLDMEEEKARLKRMLRRHETGSLEALPADGEESDRKAREGNEAGEPDPAEFRHAIEARMTSALQAMSRAGRVLAPRAEQLKGLLDSLAGRELIAGVVGLTSSGKSTFINAMMGERLLPEETRATTNLMILCRRGGVRAADAFYSDGRVERVSGAGLNPAWMEERASERRNPGNRMGIVRIEWSSPSAAVPPGIALADTPGLDACDLPGHGELVLRRLLPSLDIALYVTSIRTRFKAADVELMNAILEGDQRLIILLSQIDLERDETEAGRVLMSRANKLSMSLQDLRADLGLADVPACPIIPISSRLALEGFSNRGSEAWAASNFDPLIRQLSAFRRHIARYSAELRGRRAVSLMERAARDLTAHDSAGAREMGQNARIRALRDAHRWVSAELSSVRNEWNRELDAEPVLLRFSGELSGAASAEAFRSLCLNWESWWLELVLRMTERMDRSRETCRQTMARQDIQPAFLTEGRDGAAPELRRMEAKFRSQSRLDTLVSQYSKSLSTAKGRASVIEKGKELMSSRLGLLMEHLTWWENSMREAYCDPIYAELKREEAAAAGAREPDMGLDDKSAAGIRDVLRESANGIMELIGSGAMPDQGGFSAPIPRQPGGDEEAHDAGLFDSVIFSMREEGLRERFLLLPSLQANRRLLLLGLRRHDGLRLLSRVMHEADVSNVEAEEGQWLFSGREAPPFPCARLPEAPEGLEFLAAPSDTFCEGNVDWAELFLRWTPVVHLDLARVDSGLSDLARAPYAAALASSAPRWILAFAHGGLFDNRLPDLILDVTERVRLFAGRRGFTGRMDWFIYENYDFRYTDFLSLGKRVSASSSEADIDGLVGLWDEWDLSDAPPFGRDSLRAALARVRDRLKEDAVRATGRGGTAVTR